jgi:hypothetical protein
VLPGTTEVVVVVATVATRLVAEGIVLDVLTMVATDA